MDRIIDGLFDLDLFKGLTDTQRDAIIPAIRRVHLQRGEILFNQGEPASLFYYVVQGWMAVFRLHETGASTVLHVFGANESFAEVAAMAIGDYPASAEAATDAIVLSIPAASYRSLIESDATFAMRVIGSLAQRMRILIAEFESSQHASGAKRLASFLIDLANRNQSASGNYELPFSKQMLAARLHMKPETLSRAFSELRSQGVESSRDGHVAIADLDNLRHYNSA